MAPAMIGIVDDDLSVRKGLSRFLRSVGFLVDTFCSAEECLASQRLATIDCFVIDVHLGGMNGFELLSQLESSFPKPPVVFITAHDETITKDAVEQAGSPTCLRKPFAPESLLTSIQGLLDIQ